MTLAIRLGVLIVVTEAILLGDVGVGPPSRTPVLDTEFWETYVVIRAGACRGVVAVGAPSVGNVNAPVVTPLVTVVPAAMTMSSP
jgi:hypothetical protein